MNMNVIPNVVFLVTHDGGAKKFVTPDLQAVQALCPGYSFADNLSRPWTDGEGNWVECLSYRSDNEVRAMFNLD